MSNRTLADTHAIMQKWTPLAAVVDESESTTPIQVLAGEALDLANFITERWEPRDTGKKVLPGMRSALVTGAIDEAIARDLTELALAVSHAHGQFRAVAASTLEAPVERGEFLLSELRQCLEFIF